MNPVAWYCSRIGALASTVAIVCRSHRTTISQIQHALSHFNFDYYLRVDDDGFLCFEHFYRSLQVLMCRLLFTA